MIKEPKTLSNEVVTSWINQIKNYDDMSDDQFNAISKSIKEAYDSIEAMRYFIEDNGINDTSILIEFMTSCLYELHMSFDKRMDAHLEDLVPDEGEMTDQEWADTIGGKYDLPY